jgi:predicted amidohydrolase
MRAACLQLSVEPCLLEKNLSRALQMADAALAKGAQILVFPELFLTGFCYEPSLQSSPFAQDHPPYSSLDPFRALAEEHKCLIIGSLRSGRQNLGFCLDFLDGDGLQLRPKVHPFGEEKEHFDGGDCISPVATKWGQVGLQICYDLRFPEVARSLALQGADFLVTVAQFPALRREQWRTLAMARAIENQMPHLACNWARGGSSLIIDARGRVLAEAGSEETLILADIDLADRDLFRREVSCFADRRPEIYGGWEAERSNL